MKRSLFVAAAVATVISCTACGRDIVPKSDESPIASVTTTAAAETTTTEAVSENTTTVTTTEAENATEAAEVQTTADSQTNAVSQNNTAASADVPAGGGEAVQQAQPQQSTPSYDSVPVPGDYNYGAAPVQYDIDGITYIDGVLIANKSYSLPSTFNPGLDATCQSQFNKLQSDAAAQGLNIWFSSGFRSYDYQSQIYNNYVARDGQAAADTYSARPGYSEHQSGLAIDVNQIDDSFIGTPEAIWLENHCHEYGFILRYPQGKQDITGYKYESWHIRYVGTDMSYAIHSSGLTLEEYFGIDSYYHG